MTFEQLVVHNFGPFLGRQVIELAPPVDGRPVILFGGLNGAGKTSLLDALQLALYGKNARCSNRNGRGYPEYLQACVHRSVPQTEGAAVELSFTRFTTGVKATYRLHRSWSLSGSGLKERFEVLRDGKLDLFFTDTWDQLVEELIPSRLSQLFFFDGDKIESLADLTNSAGMLQTAVQGLLGLDIIDQLSTDLAVLRRRKAQSLKSTSETQRLDGLREEIQALEQSRGRLAQQRATAQNEVDRIAKELAKVEDEFSRQGGDLLEGRADLETQRSFLVERLGQTELRLRELAAEATPLLLVRHLLTAAAAQAATEEKARDTQLVAAILGDRDAWMLQQARKARVPASAMRVITGLLRDDRETRTRIAAHSDPYLELSRESGAAISLLLSSHLPTCASQAAELVDDCGRLKEAIVELDRRLAAIPARDALGALMQRRTDLRAETSRAGARLEHLSEELDAIGRALGSKETALASALDKQVSEDVKRSDAARVIEYARQADSTLSKFRAKVLSRHVDRIQQLVLDSFQQLLRKKSLVAGIVIDPNDFSVHLHALDGRSLSPDRLSAGERQLLAVSLLWGLARASGRPIPTVIDTPLGRLDSVHRRHLVKRYFPAASHQVVLLSTDEEINEAQLRLLEPSIGRRYRLDFDDTLQSTRIVEGYFWEQV